MVSPTVPISGMHPKPTVMFGAWLANTKLHSKIVTEASGDGENNITTPPHRPKCYV
ncbi:hypothetical protein [Scytonema sp. HK-05]|uniref:hypothetical protein n=1 Tax=Scytonema sp. HK-05 TaxID=1137095 RepID=UPI000A4DA276|nr:hypothetical protein [Scytonema sp. HK-05]